MAKLSVTELAHEDLAQAVAYTANELANPDAARAFLDKVEQCYARLRKTPQMYALCIDRHLARRQYRKAVIGNYVLIHRFDEAADTVILLRCFYAAKNYEKLL